MILGDGSGTAAAQKTIETVDKIVDQFENLTVFGNKSLNELHSIQSKRSHLSAGRYYFHCVFIFYFLKFEIFVQNILKYTFVGIFFTHPSLRM